MNTAAQSSGLRSLRSTLFTERGIPFPQLLQLLIRQLLNVDHLVPRRYMRTNQLIELQVYRFCITVLSVLDEKDDEERDDRRAGVDDELPCVGVVEDWPRRGPSEQENDGGKNRVRMSDKVGCLRCETAELQAQGIALVHLCSGFAQ